MYLQNRIGKWDLGGTGSMTCGMIFVRMENWNLSAVLNGRQVTKPEVWELVILSWYFPNRVNDWNQDCCSTDSECNITQNYYVNLFNSSWNAAEYVIGNFERLYDDTYKFHDALFKSTLPYYVIDAAASNISVIRSTTCFRTKNGKFFGYEGCFEKRGFCEGNCTHVWNYEQTLAFLFPALERDMRITEFNVETEDNGKMEFRAMRVFDKPSYNHPPAADGQLGCLIRLYRDWKLSGDNDFLGSVWPNAKKALDATVKAISGSLVAGDKVSLIGFGTFSVAERSARQGINPKTKKPIKIAAKKVAKFKAGADLSAAVN